MEQRIIEILKNARKAIVENTKPGDNVLIVADTTTDPIIWEAFSAAAHDHGAIPTVTIMTTRKGDGHDPTLPVAEAMKAADMVIFVTFRSIIHAKLIQHTQEELRAAGKPQFEYMLMEQITPEMLLGGAVEEDSDWMFQVGDRVRAAWLHAKTIHVTSEYGTDIRATIEGSRMYRVLAGRIRRTPEYPQGAMAYPDGEANLFPIEGTGEGVIVWDVSAHHVGMLTEPIKMTVEKGTVVKIEGGSQARELERFLAEQHDPNCYCAPAEIALGLNRRVVPMGLMRVDKKLYGGIHVAIGGDGTTKTGGRVKANLHLDGLMRAPRVVVDDKLVLCEGGKIVV